MHKRMAVAVGFANFFDLYDIFLGGVLAAVLAEEWGLSTNGKALVIASGFAGMFFGAILLGTMADYLYQAEIFPTRMRSTAVSTSYSLSRLSGAMLPFITVAALDHLGPTAVFLGSAAILAVVALDVAVLGPRSTGLNLETSSDEVATGARVRTAAGERRFRREEAPAATTTRTEERAEPRAR